MKKNYFLKGMLPALLSLLALNSWGQTTFNYSGSMQTYVVPSGVSMVRIECWGAQGQGGAGGLGGYVSGDLAVTPGQTLNIYVGGQNGYNGGGIGYAAIAKNGGGGSDVRVGGTAVTDRVIVAGGGGAGGQTDVGIRYGGAGGGGIAGGNYAGGAGGDGYNNDNGGAGGTVGGTAISSCHSGGGGGGGFTSGGQASCNTCYSSSCGVAGALGQGGNGDTWENGICYSSYGGTSGGGGGYYGGGGTSVGNCGGGGGGGGSSWTGSLTNNILTGGIRSGDGQVVITDLCSGLNTSVSATQVCEGEMVTLSATSNNSGTITWNNGVNDNVPFAPPVGVTTYTASSTDINDCAFGVSITVTTNPTVDAGSDIVICGTITDTVLSAMGAADSFTWDNGVTDGVSFTPTAGITTYMVTATNNPGGCTATDEVQIFAGNPSVSLTSTDEMLGNDGSITLTIVSGNSPYTFDWDNDGTGDNDDPSDLSGLAAGTYTVIMTDTSGCTTSQAIVVGSQVGLDELNGAYKVYPNPTNKLISIELNGEFSYVIYSTLAQKLIEGDASNAQDIDISNFENGTYYVKIIQKENCSVVKIIKQ